MERFAKGKVIACVCFLAAYMVVYVVLGSFDNAFDAAVAVDDIGRHNAEWALSAAFEFLAVVGLISLWIFDATTWYGGAGAGLLAAFAAGGIHVMPSVSVCLPIALTVGFAGGLVLFAVGKRRLVACALFGVEAALATVQVAFVMLSV